MTRIPLFISVSTLAFICTAQADQATLAPEVVVSATRLPTPAAHVASSVTVITREDIERRQKDSVIDLLRDVPGVAVAANGGTGQTARVFLRGTESRHTLVLIDGVPVNDPADPGNAYDFAYLSPDNLERIEVLRGPQSTLYGADAFGGVIHLITREGKGKPRIGASLSTGSFDTHRADIDSSGEIGRFHYALSGSHYETGGISAFSEKRGGRERDPSRRETFSGRLGAQLTELLSAGLTGRYTKGFAEFDGFGADNENRTHSDQYSLRASSALSLWEDRWNHEVGLGTMKLWRDSRSPSYSKFTSERHKADWVQHLRVLDTHTLTLGLEGQKEIFATNTIRERDTHTRSVFMQDQFQFGESFFAAVGGRIDDHSTFGTEATYRVAPAYLIHSTGTKLKGSVGTGFKAPSLFQLYSIFGNPNLEPEKVLGVDAGFEQRVWGDEVTFGSTAFHNSIRQLIDFEFSTLRYFNVARAYTRGLESFVTWRPSTDLTLTLTHTYLQTEDKRTRAALLRRPKHKLGFSGDYSFDEGKGSVGIGINHTGIREDVDLAFARVGNPSYTTVDVSASYRISDHAKIYARLDNLFDRQYEEVFAYGSPGFAAYAGVKVEF